MDIPPTLRRLLITQTTQRRLSSTSTHPLSSPPTHPTLNTYTKTHPPTPPQLSYANKFFRKPPKFLFSTPKFRLLPDSSHPEIAFLGRSNVGKSSLLNTLLFGGSTAKHADAARVSKKPGRTVTMNGYGVLAPWGSLGVAGKGGERGEVWRRFPVGGGFVIVDMPGYGKGSRGEWGVEIMKYLVKRRQLRRTFVLVDAEHGVKESDVQLLGALRGEGVQVDVVLSKVDKVLGKRGRVGELERVKDKVGKVLSGEGGVYDIFCCSSQASLDASNGSKKIGIDELRWSLLTACGLESDEKGLARRSPSGNLQIQDQG